MYFTRHGSQTQPLPSEYATVIKAACVHTLASTTHLTFQADAGRALWEAVLQRRQGDASRFTWAGLTVDDVTAAEEYMLSVWGKKTVYKMCGKLQSLLDVLGAAQIVRPMEIRFRTPRPRGADQQTLEEMEATSAEKLVSDEAIDAVADIFREFATERMDRILACICALLWTTGLRIGEVLTLPATCIITEGSGVSRRTGLRFNKEKSEGRRKVRSTFWFPTASVAALARQAVRELQKLTEQARAQAAILEENGAAVSLDRMVRDENGRLTRRPGQHFAAWLERETVADLLGFSDPGSVNAISRTRLPRETIETLDGKATGYRAGDVMTYLQDMREERTPASIKGAVTLEDGSVQRLSESLCVLFLNEAHDQRGTEPDARHARDRADGEQLPLRALGDCRR